MYKQFYRRFLDAHRGELHFTAHSHHFWPDVTREAQMRCWDDAARYLDGKWEYLQSTLFAETRNLIARFIGSHTPDQIAFAPNTHEFVCRLVSCFEGGRPLAVLTTDSEFHSFRRQVKRLTEYPWAKAEQVAVDPLPSFPRRFADAATSGRFQLIFLSHVFFNSGYVAPDLAGLMEDLVARVPEETLLVLDGYHGFCAIPTDIAPFAHRVFYLAGGYKYAQAGEGACFMHVPPGCGLRPANTGWFAEFETLAGTPGGRVDYPDGGARFAGATFDPGGIYRLHAVLDLFRRRGLDGRAIHDYVSGLQGRFLQQLRAFRHADINCDNLLRWEECPHGHFYVFRLASSHRVQTLLEALERRGVYGDGRGDRIRFGFGLYHDNADIDELFRRLAGL